MQVPPGYAMFIPSAIREAVSLPVVGVGRFKDPLQADRALEAGQADLIGVVRGQIADPDFVRKARAGAAADIRTCLSCNQECVGRMGLNRWLGCIENPRTGRESVALPDAHQAVPAGARRRRRAGRAAGGGHRRRARPPRHAVRAGRPARRAGARRGVPCRRRAEFLDITRNLVSAAQRVGVDVRTSYAATADLLLGERPDVVVLATGAVPHQPWWAGDLERVVDVRDVLEGRAAPTGRVLVFDELGFHQATSVAELLADRGCAVEVATPGMVVGQDLGITLDLETWNVKAAAKGITQPTDVVPMSAVDEGGRITVGLQHHPTGTDVTRTVTGSCAPCSSAPTTRSGTTCRPRRSRCTASGTAWHRAGRTPPSSRATGWRWPCDRHQHPPRHGRGRAARAESAGRRPGARRHPAPGCPGGRRRGRRPGAAARFGHRRRRRRARCAPGLARRDGRRRPRRTGPRARAPAGAGTDPRAAGEPRRARLRPAAGRCAGPTAARLGRVGSSSTTRARPATLHRLDGRLEVEVRCDGPCVVTLVPGARSPLPASNGEVLELHLDVPPGVDAQRLAVLEPDPATMDLSEARRVVGAGAGLVRDDESAAPVLALLTAVAARLGASTGATRVLTDAGQVHHDRQIGTTGVSVSPELYLALGVAGATQHTGGLGHPAPRRQRQHRPVLPDDGDGRPRPGHRRAGVPARARRPSGGGPRDSTSSSSVPDRPGPPLP